MRVDFNSAVRNMVMEQKTALGLRDLPKQIQFKKDPEMQAALAQACEELTRGIAKRMEMAGLKSDDDWYMTNCVRKMAAYATKQRWRTPAALREGFSAINPVLVDALHENPKKLLRRKSGIAGILNMHTMHYQQLSAKLRAELVNNPDLSAPQKIFDLQGGYQLVELLTETDLKAESAGLGHCVGTGSGGDYHRKIRSGESRIFSLRDKGGQSLATIDYKCRLKAITQIEGKPRKISDEADFLPALCEALGRLKGQIDISAGIKGLPTKKNMILTADKGYISLDMRNLPAPETVLAADKMVHISEFMPRKIVRALCAIPMVSLDITGCGNTWLDDTLPEHVAGNLYTSSKGSLELCVLKSAGGILADNVERMELNCLEKAGDITAETCKEFSFNELTKAGNMKFSEAYWAMCPKLELAGDIFVNEARKFNFPCLRAAANINASKAKLFSSKRLQSAGDIKARAAEIFFCPELENAGSIIAIAAIAFSCPKLQVASNIWATFAKSFLCPKLQKAGSLLMNDAISVFCPQLKNAETISATMVEKLVLHPQCECANMHLPANKPSANPALRI